MGRYSADRMPNGLYFIRDRRTGLAGCYLPDGTYRHGGLRLAMHDAAAIIGPAADIFAPDLDSADIMADAFALDAAAITGA